MVVQGGTTGQPIESLGGTGTTAADLLAFTRDLLAETYEDFYDDAAILRDLNAGIVRLFSRVNALPAKATITLDAGADTYAAPHDLARFGRVFVDSVRTPLEPCDADELGAPKSGRPTHYCPDRLMGDGSPAIQVYPTPTKSGVLTINYWRIPAMLSVTEDLEVDPTWHARYHFLPCYYAAGVQLHKDKRPENAELMMSKFERGIVEYKRWLAEKRPDRTYQRQQVRMREM